MAKKKEVLDKMFLQIDKFKQEHKLNLYTKEQLGNTFKWTLKDAGYDTEFVADLTKMLMLRQDHARGFRDMVPAAEGCAG